MDSSLSKALKKGFLKDLYSELEISIKIFSNQVDSSNLSINRKIWPKFYNECERLLGSFLICKFNGGTRKNPLIALMVFEPSEHAFNSWNEFCLTTTQMIIGYKPWHFEGIPGGFNVGEHAIQRFYQRSISNEQVLRDGANKYLILSELKLAGLWSGYWTMTHTDRSTRLKSDILYPVIPSKSGLFLGEMRSKSFHRLEIRTFIHESMLSEEQNRLRTKMLDTSKRFLNSSIAFFSGLLWMGKPDRQQDWSLMHEDTNCYLELLDHASLIRFNVL